MSIKKQMFNKDIILTYSKYFSSCLQPNLFSIEDVNTGGIYTRDAYTRSVYIRNACTKDAYTRNTCNNNAYIENIYTEVTYFRDVYTRTTNIRLYVSDDFNKYMEMALIE